MRSVIYIFSGLILLLGAVSCGSEVEVKSQKIAFIESSEVFESFAMKKDYDVKIEADLKALGEKVDSLAGILNQNTGNLDSLRIYELRRIYYVAENNFKVKFDELSTTYTAEVNTRLNKYIEEYGKENGYNFILGSSGQGNVMYVGESDNITKDMIKYVNKKYSK